ncbi:MAG: hypothetical protein A3G33_02565 [Omnitrophica bacterium RIFCSPLOWO2_12_FULL_44_17]|uniref:ABC transporter domain-containing protein n=1 Tax=Candidatus Danuiimicrobium aquiferis TaxID=1801832 RepID=A0A1G1KZK0_9BACT|nr:MAG: hypothetical protein A3B72_08055 [Omnitrophica bacterium RIFCSPHIGHO2_02_FULL_45_28]OGW89445.1 MAG: hypothetical protein A3E74_07530 [Omnitrophica bacterium RIFCSPHIGHO2_12_FULL_44_12]OGW98338.1 MAG: hypothetical protein A3G33_02565 [Omnitrophica bacterium RIFCSPLOWO2_12_FULL_44_17]OGX02896.1 MAG: hypothetical protein A3J12_05070 [Omnitrophica bacterium RIFCSPLOWO2_02_FULL_44_11]
MVALLQIKSLYKSYGALSIFKDASVSFSSDQKIGVVGRNGAGKSTLCKILTGEEEMDSGVISPSSNLKLSYLEQQDPFRPGETIIDFLMRYTRKEEWECAQVSGRFQLRYDLLQIPISALPGGYQTRVKLAAMMLADPNFLILDEPSNYLDLSTLILLENFLQDFRGGYLIVSHDREFLKRTCDHTLEVENGRMVLYPGSIEEYFEFKEEQTNQKLAFNRAVEKKREQLQEFVDRFRAKASTASRAKSKVKQMEKLKTIGIEHSASTVRINIPPVENKAGIAFSCDDLSVGYPEKLVASKINLEIDRGTRVAVLGDNGQGKTTFLRSIAGNLSPKGGVYRWGTGLKVAYYAQHVYSALDPEDDIYSHLSREADSSITNQDILNIAGCFLFRGDDVRKKIGVLSGGERARVSLAGLLLAKCHVLLLDEPTNHLDFETVEALGKALKKYSGTVLFISHDRTFVNLVATMIIEIKDGFISKYPGSYEDYVYSLEVKAREERGPENLIEEEEEAPKEGETVLNVSGSQAENLAEQASECECQGKEGDYLERKRVKSEIVRMKVLLKKMEIRLANLNQERDNLLADIKQNPFHYSKQRNERINKVTVVIEEEEDLWLELQHQVEELQKQL